MALIGRRLRRPCVLVEAPAPDPKAIRDQEPDPGVTGRERTRRQAPELLRPAKA